MSLVTPFLCIIVGSSGWNPGDKHFSCTHDNFKGHKFIFKYPLRSFVNLIFLLFSFTDNDGNIHILDRDQKLSEFKAYEFRTSLLFQMKQHNILASVGVFIFYQNLSLNIFYF